MGKRLGPTVQRAIEHFTRRLREALGTELLAVKLFGSHVRGEASPESDVDLFVLVKERTWRLEALISDTAFETNLTFELFVAPTVYGEREFHDPVLQETPFLRTIEREGALVWESRTCRGR